MKIYMKIAGLNPQTREDAYYTLSSLLKYNSGS